MATRLSKAIKNRDFPEDSEEAERIRELQEEQKELEEKYRQIASASGFRGISFDDWLDTFITVIVLPMWTVLLAVYSRLNCCSTALF
jgi:hypothetical protein